MLNPYFSHGKALRTATLSAIKIPLRAHYSKNTISYLVKPQKFHTFAPENL